MWVAVGANLRIRGEQNSTSALKGLHKQIEAAKNQLDLTTRNPR